MEKTIKRAVKNKKALKNLKPVARNRVFKPIEINERSFKIATPDTIKELKSNFTNKKVRSYDLSTLPKRIEHMIRSGAGVTTFDLERIIGNNDMVRINYLERGLNAAKTVCRIFVNDMQNSERWWGTGFLISPNLLLTNNHVLSD